MNLSEQFVRLCPKHRKALSETPSPRDRGEFELVCPVGFHVVTKHVVGDRKTNAVVAEGDEPTAARPLTAEEQARRAAAIAALAARVVPPCVCGKQNRRAVCDTYAARTIVAWTCHECGHRRGCHPKPHEAEGVSPHSATTPVVEKRDAPPPAAVTATPAIFAPLPACESFEVRLVSSRASRRCARCHRTKKEHPPRVRQDKPRHPLRPLQASPALPAVKEPESAGAEAWRMRPERLRTVQLVEPGGESLFLRVVKSKRECNAAEPFGVEWQHVTYSQRGKKLKQRRGYRSMHATQSAAELALTQEITAAYATGWKQGTRSSRMKFSDLPKPGTLRGGE